jgi:glycosyltransferase involved in cell wall biosynthesis
MTKLGIIRGKFLNKSDMQSYEPLINRYDMTAFGSLFPYDDSFAFPTKKLFSPMDIPPFPYKMPILNRLFIDAHHLYGLERKINGIDIIDTAETYFYFTRQVMTAKKRGFVRKVIVRSYENIPFNNEGIWGRKALKAYVRKYADHFIAVSKKSKYALEKEGVDFQKISVIGHGIDTKRFLPDKDHWKRLGKNTKRPLTVLFVGRLEKEKGVYDVINALRMISRDENISQLNMIFAGAGSEKSNMKKIIGEYGLATRTTFISVPYSKMPDLYKRADIFVAPSKSTKTWEEQFNIALLEAQSTGLPIVTTKSGAIPENVGDAALFAKEGDSQSIAEQIIRFLQNPFLRVRYGKMARDRAIKFHDIHIIADKLDYVYQSLV